MTEVNEPRRRFLIGATSFVAGAGVVGVATPFVQSWNPSAKAKAGVPRSKPTSENWNRAPWSLWSGRENLFGC